MDFLDWDCFNEDIYLKQRKNSKYNRIYAGSIAWYIVRFVQVLLLFAGMVFPYLFAIILASVLGF